jgi:pSer/pThr/pTyr-binding forkhead associated (FHA) protein
MRYRVRAELRTALLGEGELVIGRSAYCSLVLEHATVSRVHAAIRKAGDGLEIVDFESCNGTFVNGARVKAPAPVAPGDAIRVGSVPVVIDLVPVRVAIDTGRLIFGDTEDATLNRPLEREP